MRSSCRRCPRNWICSSPVIYFDLIYVQSSEYMSYKTSIFIFTSDSSLMMMRYGGYAGAVEFEELAVGAGVGSIRTHPVGGCVCKRHSPLQSSGNGVSTVQQ